MDSVDQQVLMQLHAWLEEGLGSWLCTVVKTVGSSPRPVGSLLVCNEKGRTVGSLSGGCVEEDLIEKLIQGDIAKQGPECIKYGVSAAENERLGLPCGGRLHVLIEPVSGEQLSDFAAVNECLGQRRCCERVVDVLSGQISVKPVEHYQPLHYDDVTMRQVYGPRYLMVLVGAGILARCLAEMALMLDYRVVVCDPREEVIEAWTLAGVELKKGMPDDIVREMVRDKYSIVITLTHDPRIDDMALMEALTQQIFYVGALGSLRTSEKRRVRLAQLGLSDEQLNKLHAPVGLSIGSKTPPEVAIAILAQLTKMRANVT